jgi:NTP pyrophosphatase (non-canonical NTP hydrolase)
MDNEILNIAQEEFAECIMVISKIKRFGIDSYHPFNQPVKTNKQHLVEELGDALAMISLLQQEYELSNKDLHEAKYAKFQKLKKWSSINVENVEI